MNPPIVFVVDDDPSASRGVARLLTSARYRAETFASAADFLAREPYSGPSCLVLDMMMPGMSGLELQDLLLATGHKVPIVFITGRGDVPSSVRAMKGGAVDFLLKPFSADELLGAVARAIERGQRDAAQKSEFDSVLARWNSLTRRERQVLALVVAGSLNKQAAFRLGITEKTIKIHRAHVMEKMGAQSFAELVRLAETLKAAGAPLQDVGAAEMLLEQ